MKVKVLVGVLAGVCLLISSAVVSEDLDDRAKSSRMVAKQFAKELKGHLKKAVHDGGPVGAIKVCAEIAPEIAAELSKKQDWRVARTSLKYRNSANAPDAWETKVLNEFEKRKDAGESPEKMEYYETVEENGQKSFRYMKAIPAKSPCLICHGKNISEEVAKVLDEYYPEDRARGFARGDIRGAFSITQPLEAAK